MNKAGIIQELSLGICVIHFIKKDGTDRVMVGCRNTVLMSSMDMHYGSIIDIRDSRLSGNNIAVIDLEIKDLRALNTDKIVSIKSFGDIRNDGECFRKACEYAQEVRKKIENNEIDTTDNLMKNI